MKGNSLVLKFDLYVLSSLHLQCREPLGRILRRSAAHRRKLVAGKKMVLFICWEFPTEWHWKSWGALPRSDKGSDVF